MSRWEFTEGSEGISRQEVLSEGVVREVFSPREIEEQIPEESEMRELYGDPETDARHWHAQSGPYSCAADCREFAARSLLGESDARTAEKWKRQAEWSRWGEDMEHMGAPLAGMGFNVSQEYGCDIQDVCQVLDEGGKVLVGVCGAALRFPEYAQRPGVRADYTVQVIGVRPGEAQVLLNDPGWSEGAQRSVRMEDFLRAWAASDRLMVSVYR